MPPIDDKTAAQEGYVQHSASCGVTRGEPCDCPTGLKPGSVIEFPEPPKRIRVLRILEYSYIDAEAMTRDMEHWSLGAISNNNRGYVSIRSTCMLPHQEED